MIIIEEFKGGDGAHCGIADWYPAKRDALKRALKSGQPFDTGWYSSKKEIVTARIHSCECGDVVNVEVSVSDDFDTPGYGSDTCRPLLSSIARALHRAWNEASEEQKENRQYHGYSVVHWSVEIPKWLRGPGIYPRERRKRYHKKVAQCVDFFIAPAGDEFCSPVGDGFAEGPPGDHYSHWGWQRSDDDGKTPEVGLKIPEAVVSKLAEFASSGRDGFLRLGDWEIKSWDSVRTM